MTDLKELSNEELVDLNFNIVKEKLLHLGGGRYCGFQMNQHLNLASKIKDELLNRLEEKDESKA